MANEFDNIFISGPLNWKKSFELREKAHLKKKIPLLKSSTFQFHSST
jgi:hypothetical protein